VRSGSSPMYLCVLLRLLCPKSFITAYTLFVLCSSVVAFQCLRVWKCICRSLGLPVFRAIRFLARKNPFLVMFLLLYGKILFVLCGSAFNMVANLFDTLRLRGLLPFSGLLIDSVLASVSKSVHFSCSASPYLHAVSFRVCKNVASRCFVPLISWSISVSVGMNVILSVYLYDGRVSAMCAYL